MELALEPTAKEECNEPFMKTLVLNTLGKDVLGRIYALIKDKEVEIVDTSDRKIAHCMGCNRCWLKTPGICAIKAQIVAPYEEMGRIYAREGNFLTPEAKKITGPDQYPWWVRKMVSLLFLKKVNRGFEDFANRWGCTRPLNDKPYSG